MSPFQLYIGIEREVKKYNSDIKINTADITYWLNKALNEFIDTKYASFESTESIRKDLGSLINTSTITTPTTTAFNSTTNLNTFTLPDVNTRFILSERITITYQTVDSIVPVKPVTLDELNAEVADPFSTYKIHLNRVKPLRYDAGSTSVIVSETTYTVKNYTITRLLNPTLFTIASAIDTSEYTVIPKKSHPELLTLAVRQILENESNPRYQTYNIEEIKSKQ